MVDDNGPCIKGLSSRCFQDRPQHAKQVFAYRILGILLGLRYIKRLQTFKGLPLPISLYAEMGAPLTDFALTGIFSNLPPFLVSVWEGGPVHLTQAIEGELFMPTIRRAKIDFSLAENKEIVEGVSGKKICITNIGFTVGGETNITFKSNTTAISGAMDFGAANEPRGLTHGLGLFPLETAEGEGFFITSSLAVQVSGYVTYYLD
ncbi:hypothetical protein ES703_74438 [subsurface metagenome]